jgi:hypothetical protein
MAPVNISNYKVAPNGVIHVLDKKAAQEMLFAKKDLMNPDTIYVRTGRDFNEFRQAQAALNAGLPLALCGPNGVGKTTLVEAIALMNKIPMTTIPGDRNAKSWNIIGTPREQGDLCFFEDGPVSLAARAQAKSIIYLDEAFDNSTQVFTSMVSMLDHRQTLELGSTGEIFKTDMIHMVLAYNPLPIANIDVYMDVKKVFDRVVMIRFPELNGDAALKLINAREEKKSAEVGKLTTIPFADALKKYGGQLAAVYDKLNVDVRGSHNSVMVKDVGPRGLINALKLISAGLEPVEAAMMALVNPLVPGSDTLVDSFLVAAKGIVESQFGTGRP